MIGVDLNLLRVLDALLSESSVTRAAERLGTSPPAVSRALAKMRRLVGDPLLVRAGQTLVPTTRGAEIHRALGPILAQIEQMLRPGTEFYPKELRRTFAVQAADLFLSPLAGPLLERLGQQAPQVDVVFVPEAYEDTGALRRGDVDIELGVLGDLDPEIQHRPLAAVPILGLARAEHPLFAAPIDAAQFARWGHIGVSRRGRKRGPIDDALERKGLRRRVHVVVPGYTSALLLARSTDLVTITTADWCDTALSLGLRTFPVPFDIPHADVGLAWHPRNDADPAHQWFRGLVAATFATGRAVTEA